MKLLKKFLIFLMISLIISNNAYADSAVFLEEGKPAPYSGYLFTETAGQKLKVRLVEADYYEKMLSSLETQINLYENINKTHNEKYNILLEQNDKLAKTLHSQQSLNNWERIGLFGLGILTTVLVLYGVKQATK